jgi:phosphoglycerate kinase
MAKLIVSDLDVKDKKVLVRVDFNVPIKNGVIGDDNRIVAALPTIQYIIDNNGKAILFSHLGRVKTEEDKKELSLRPVAERLSELLKKPVTFVPATRGKELEDAINNMKDGDVLVVENTRFEDLDGKKESKNDPELGKYWASLGDLYVNDAFGTAHRSHASNVGISSNMPQAAAGFLMEKEIKFLGDAVENPKHPFVAILGGAKVSDKIGVISNLIEKADKILVGGGMTYTFYAAKGLSIGKSLVETDKIDLAKQIIAEAGDKLVCLLITWLLPNSPTTPLIRLLKVTFLMATWLWISALSLLQNSKTF